MEQPRCPLCGSIIENWGTADDWCGCMEPHPFEEASDPRLRRARREPVCWCAEPKDAPQHTAAART